MNIHVEKKQKKKISRWVLLFIPFIVLLLFICLYHMSEIGSIFVDRDEPDSGKSKNVSLNDFSQQDHDEVCLIEERDTDELYSVRIQPSGGDSYVLANIDGEMYIEGDTESPIKENVSLGIRNYATHIEAIDFVTDLSHTSECNTDTSVYGLEFPCVTVEITYTDGQQITFFLGNSVEVDDRLYYYMKTAHNSYIYLVTSDFYDVFSYPVLALPPVPVPNINVSLIDAFCVHGEADFEIVYRKGNWVVTRPILYPANNSKVESSLLKPVENMLFYAYIGEKNTLNLSLYGLNDPRISVDIIMADTIVEGYDTDDNFHSESVSGYTHHLLIGDDYNSSAFYCLYDDVVYIGTYKTIGQYWFDIDPYDFYLRNPVNLPTNSLNEITVCNGDNCTVYSFDYIEKLPEPGKEELNEPVYDIFVYRNGTLISTNSFFSWYSQLTGLSVSGILRSDMIIDDREPDISLVIKSQDTDRRIDLFKADTLNYAVSVDGNALFFINASKIKEITEMP